MTAPLDLLRQEFDVADEAFLALVRSDATRESLALAASDAAAAAKCWETVAYREFFALRARKGAEDRAVIELEIDAEKAETLRELYADLGAAYTQRP